MNRLFCLGAILVVAALGSLQSNPIPVKELFRTFVFNQIHMSPDGRMLATVFPHSWEGETASLGLAISDLDTGQSQVLHRQKYLSVVSVEWVADDRLLTTVWSGLYLNRKVGRFANDTDGGRFIEIVPPGQSSPLLGADMIAPAPTGGGVVLMGRRPDGDYWHKQFQRRPGVFRLDTYTGKHELIREDPDWTIRWFVDHAGTPRVAFGFDKTEFKPDGGHVKPGELLQRRIYWIDDEGTARPIDAINLGWREEFQPLGFDLAGEKFLFFGRQGRDLAALYAYNPATATVEGPLLQSEECDLDRAVFSPYDRQVVGVRIDEGLGRVVWLHPELQKIAPTVDQALPGCRNIFVGWGRDFRRLLVHSAAPAEPARYFLFDRDKNSISEIYRPADWLAGFAMGAPEAFSLTARDGVRLHGFFTRPPGAPAGRPLPTVLLVHGGPWTIRDGVDFDPNVQFFATRGYAVLQVNYRGSSGRGRAFEELARREFGQAMQHDLYDAVDWAVAQGWADPARLIVAGTSYGGYASLMALMQEPGRFRAGVAMFPVTDLGKQIDDYRIRNTEGNKLQAYAWWREWVGDPVADRAQLAAVSPLYHVPRLKAPVFIVYGDQDDRVQFDQSASFVRQLRSHRKTFERFAPRDEGHSLRREENRYEVYGALEKFLAKHAPAP